MATPNCRASTARSWPSTPRNGSRSSVVVKLNWSGAQGRVRASGARRRLAAKDSGIGSPCRSGLAAGWDHNGAAPAPLARRASGRRAVGAGQAELGRRQRLQARLLDLPATTLAQAVAALAQA